MTVRMLVLLLALPFVAVAAKLPEDYAPPAIAMPQAVALAKQCLTGKGVDVQSLYLQTATFLPTRQLSRIGADRGRQWLVTWQRPDTPIGGQTTVNVYEDSSCSVGYGE